MQSMLDGVGHEPDVNVCASARYRKCEVWQLSVRGGVCSDA